ncbi:hypothetical protein ACJVDH_08135 [Pedobacter sp. AW1-32]|uniref:hypothetical protein n=1 Tax=Pedobacter sp. AW1-32 TaxID=3383026 RepID=UPI003FEF6183
MKKMLCFAVLCFGILSACKKQDTQSIPDSLSEDQQKIQGRWTQIYFKRIDYRNGALDRVVEGEVTSGEYVEFFGNRYRFNNGSQLVDDGSTFYFDSGELAIRNGSSIFYSTIKWQSADAYIEVVDDGSAAGGPANKSVFEYSYVRKSN